MDISVRVELSDPGIILNPVKQTLGVTRKVTNHSEENIRLDFRISASHPQRPETKIVFDLSVDLAPEQTKTVKSDIAIAYHVIHQNSVIISVPYDTRIAFLDDHTD